MGMANDSSALPYKPIEIILGSESDMSLIELALLPFLRQCKVPFRVSVMSAHRHSDIVRTYAKERMANAGDGPLVFIALAGLKNDLASAIVASTNNEAIVIGVALPNDKDPSASRSDFPTLANMPGGTALLWSGYTKGAILNAGISAMQIVCQSNQYYLTDFRSACKKMADEKPVKISYLTDQNGAQP